MAAGLRRTPSYGTKAYTGREWDPEIGMYYYRARYYDPKIGRFVSEDPMGFGADVNFYRYVYDSPTNFVDPYGLDVQLCLRRMGGPDLIVGKGNDEIKHPVVSSTTRGLGMGFGPDHRFELVTPWFSVPGHIKVEYPYDLDGKPKDEFACHTRSTDPCVEECVIETATFESMNPPKYNVGTFQCNDWAEKTIGDCIKACGGVK